MKKDNFVFFWGGPFSQWFRQSFILHGTEYNCAEQYMMAMKAQVFNDQEALEKIMKSKDPREQKAFGRKVKGFDAEQWNAVCKKFVYEANYAKFGNNPYMKKILLDTGDKEIVEASPYDTIWGIGLSETDPDRFDKTKWRGTNWLGEVLMQVRNDLRGT